MNIPFPSKFHLQKTPPPPTLPEKIPPFLDIRVADTPTSSNLFQISAINHNFKIVNSWYAEKDSTTKLLIELQNLNQSPFTPSMAYEYYTTHHWTTPKDAPQTLSAPFTSDSTSLRNRNDHV